MTESVSGSASSAFVASGLKPPMPHAVSTIQSLRTELSTDALIDAFVDAANTVMNATRPTPIISADAVAARAARVARRVLPGDRAGHPAQAGERRTEHRANGRAMHRAEHRDADEHDQRTETDRGDRAARQAHGDERRTARP